MDGLFNMPWIEEISRGLTKPELLQYFKRIQEELKESTYSEDMRISIDKAIKDLELQLKQNL